MSDAPHGPLPLTMTHWGAYRVETDGRRPQRLLPFERDGEPSPIGQSMAGAIDHPCRIDRPMIRRGWLDNGPTAGSAGRGTEPFVAVDWTTAIDLAATEVDRVRRAHGNQAIFAGSYGWASAGRFHHAQSQIHRFMNLIGGYTRSVNTYSHAAAEVIVPHVLGLRFEEMQVAQTSWPVIAEATRLMICFGGVPLKNAQISSGGIGRHGLGGWLEGARRAGTRFVNIGPLRGDLPDGLEAEWLAPRPGTDTALMLGLAHTLWTEGLADSDFLARYTTGLDRFLPYLLGTADGRAKDAAWAADITGLPAGRIAALAREMAATRTLISVAWSVQRTDHGEQPYWTAIVLAAMLGQIGLPGGGLGFGYGAVASVGNGRRRIKAPHLPRDRNPVDTFIPVARITDMLLHPGEPFDYDGQRLTYPDIRLVYWCGGNPFHHHQDLGRLVRAWRRPETVIVHEPFWNPLARFADIVLPVTTALERNDIGGSAADAFLMPMRRVAEPVGSARDDYAIFAAMAERLGCGHAFTEGRDEMGWLREIYERYRQQSNALPDFDSFWNADVLDHTGDNGEPLRQVLLSEFRDDPGAHPLATPSGRIEIFSPTVHAFGYDDCPGHPVWLEPYEWLGGPQTERYPLHLVSNQPKTRLHSQWDHGAVSVGSKVQGREPARLHPDDARARGIADGDIVRVFNDRGACLAGAVLSDRVRPGCIQLATGAWYDPADPSDPASLERHGNPNVLTRDVGTSRLAQAPTAHTCLVEVERFDGPVPPVGAFQPPEILDRG
ncbi:MAG: molybdopterin-dependent oxidoreductase [Rhodospirillaceae bacterium]|nr:molybdopterin-dependent oxidoreductase [Rhodospirillaceae bacterium]